MVPRPRVVNIDGLYPEHYAYERKRIEATGAEFILAPATTTAAILSAAAEADIILIERTSRPFTREMMAALPRCRGLVACGVGFDGIDVAAATGLGIVVCHAADYCTAEVADHAAALVLAAARRLFAFDRGIRSGATTLPLPGLRRLSALTVGLVGYGRIGRAVAQRLAGFGVKLLASSRRPTGAPDEAGVIRVALDQLLAESDLVSMHLPLTPATTGFIGEKELRRMKPTALLVNTGRGATVDGAALVRALQEKWIAGAALDVTDPEPLPLAHPLLSLSQVILTPHIGGVSDESEALLPVRVAESVEALMRGDWPPFPVNPEVRRRPG